MGITFGRQFSDLRRIFENTLEHNHALQLALAGMDVQIGLAGEAAFATPAHASEAFYVGDSARVLDKIIDAATEAQLQLDPSKVLAVPRYNAARRGWDYEFSLKQPGGALDAAPDLLAGQMFTPWNVAYFTEIFREPLSYSSVRRLVRRHSGDNPWCKIMSLLYRQYAGWAMETETGDLQNQHTNDVNVIDGLMSAPVINLAVTWTVTLEDLKRDEYRAGNPFAGTGIAELVRYARYALEMLTDVIYAYGNTDGNIAGILTVTPTRVHSGTSIKGIAQSASATRGADIYKLLAREVNSFLAEADNKYNKVVIAASPAVNNYLTSTPYSDAYAPASAAKIFAENYLAGKGPGGATPAVEFVSEPLFKEKSIFNAEDEDYFVIAAPEVGGGPDNEPMPLILAGEPLSDFIFPVIPGMYNSQYKMLKRTAGVFAPVPQALRVYKGLGVQSGD
jgi:hypothetical protein